MSRAFIKETDEVFDLPARVVSEHPNLVTERGLKLIEAEVASTRKSWPRRKRPKTGKRSPRRSGSCATGPRGAQTAELQPPPARLRASSLRLQVTIERDDGRKQTFRIVGEDEADPAAKTLSYASPLAHALIGKEVDDVVEVGRARRKS